MEPERARQEKIRKAKRDLEARTAAKGSEGRKNAKEDGEVGRSAGASSSKRKAR